MLPDVLWQALGGGAIVAVALAIARLLLEYSLNGGQRHVDQDERRRASQRDAEARLERILQDRLAESDRRLERADAELRAERVRAATLEHELLRMRQAHELLELQYAALVQADNAHHLTP